MQIPAIIQTLLKNLENNKKILSSHDTYTKMLFMLKTSFTMQSLTPAQPELQIIYLKYSLN